MKKPLIIIRRITTYRYLGCSEAAARLGVSRQAVSNHLNGYRGLSPDKAAQLKIVEGK